MKRITNKFFPLTNSFRKFIHILFAASLSTSLLFSASSFGDDMDMIDEVVAIANNGVIMRSELEQRIYDLQRTTSDTQAQNNVEKIALEQLILETIQLQIGKRAQVKISDDEIDAALNNIAEQENRTVAQLQAAIEQEGGDFKDFKAKVRRDAIINRVQHGSLRDKLQISDREVSNYLQSTHGQNITATQYRLLNIMLEGEKSSANQAFMTKLRASLLNGEVSLKGIIDKQRFDDRALKVSDMGWLAEEAIPSDFKTVAKSMQPRDISAPVASKKGYSILLLIDKQGLQEVMVKQYNARHILIKQTNIRSARSAEDLTANIRQRAIKGEDFASLAKLFSDDEGSAATGGNLGWSTPDRFVPEFAEALSKLEKGQISPVVKTQFGWHIIQLLDTREHNASEDMLRNKARQVLYQRKFDNARKEWLAKIRNDAYIELK